VLFWLRETIHRCSARSSGNRIAIHRWAWDSGTAFPSQCPSRRPWRSSLSGDSGGNGRRSNGLEPPSESGTVVRTARALNHTINRQRMPHGNAQGGRGDDYPPRHSASVGCRVVITFQSFTGSLSQLCRSNPPATRRMSLV